MTNIRCAIFLSGLLWTSISAVHADGFESHREQVLGLGKLTTAPAVTAANDADKTGNVKAIYFDGLPWKGKPTKVFAWLGMPENREGKVPGVVLVHGGGGTAFKDWVARWNAHGFAAISIAVEGQTDETLPKDAQGRRGGWKSHYWAGPKRVGIYGDSEQPLEDQWMYHAVADTILANSLLRSLPQVDSEKVGLMGISWGGVITSTVAGIDDRFSFAIPTYGCGRLFDAPNQYGRSLGSNELYKQVWDPMVRMDQATMPMLWLSWPGDKHFPLDCQAACYRAASGPQSVTLIPELKHGHGPPWKVPDGYEFAKSVVQNGKPWCLQTGSTVSDSTCRVKFTSEKPFDKAVLISTTDTGFTGARNWIESPAELSRDENQYSAVAKLPAGTTAWFVNMKSGELVASSEYQVDLSSSR